MPERRNLPHTSLGEFFKGRDDILNDLRRRLLSEDQTIRAIVAPQPIYGLGGVGKTQLAVEYAWPFGTPYSALLFVTADTAENLQQNLANLCGVLKIKAEGLQDERAKRHNKRDMNYPRSVATTWDITIDKLSDPAKELLNTLAWLAPDPIPVWLFEAHVNQPTVDRSLSWLGRCARWGRALLVTRSQFRPLKAYDNGLAELTAYSMTTRHGRDDGDGSDTVRLHRLVQEITRFHTPADERVEQIERALQLVNAVDPGDPTDVRTWRRWDSFRPHMAAASTIAWTSAANSPP